MAAKDPSPGSWRGSLKSPYPIGPGFSDPDWKIELLINTATVSETRYDVVAAIRGIHEPGDDTLTVTKESPVIFFVVSVNFRPTRSNWHELKR